ncbi:MAG: hypothetical protein CBC03_01300 [Pseudoalteromonas sp. TMED43]|jgi:hypothetical protein|nr:MAG: hypothetical protein CBC03_01300 [Pseudoalteromonas sp. TMED43]|tara:strand:- start:20 stop:280 length:261 start_codon:yes stop_codon:yes gene_type:complete
MKCLDYLKSDDGRVHVINAKCTGSTLSAGIFCSVAMDKNTCRISDDNHSFTIELPDGLFSKSDRVKAFNVDLAILKHEQVQLPSSV